jgi:hypothetical protein
VGNDASISSNTPRKSQYFAKIADGRWATDGADGPGLLSATSSFSIDERHFTLGDRIAPALRSTRASSVTTSFAGVLYPDGEIPVILAN